jgi:hypothetical protein
VKPAVFPKNRDRLLTSDVARRFFAEVNRPAKKFMSDEHFTVDGTLIRILASQNSFRSRDGSNALIPIRGCTRRATARSRR